jgi:hypothetical protein
MAGSAGSTGPPTGESIGPKGHSEASAGEDPPTPGPDPRKKPFYGWYIVGVMASAAAVSMGMGSLNFGLFIKPMGDELGISRATFGWASTARQGASAVTSPVVGSRVMLPIPASVTVEAMIGLGSA